MFREVKKRAEAMNLVLDGGGDPSTVKPDIIESIKRTTDRDGTRQMDQGFVYLLTFSFPRQQSSTESTAPARRMAWRTRCAVRRQPESA
jgi:hypothetical protein